ncbi:MAG TPA: glucosamine-6-phosphate deaminase [Opitutaceae bacterium]|nr:glucosamine-6-phosphate deaminase [Opitutaceae bacterium]
MASPAHPSSPEVLVYAHRRSMGAAAARNVQAIVEKTVKEKGTARVIFACAPSQDDMYAALIPLARATPAVWKAVEVFHMDDYLGLDETHPQSFRNYLRRHFLSQVEVAVFHPLRGEATDGTAEARRYAGLLEAAPIDLISLGVGENGHLAFNDPPVADFQDPVSVKIVELDAICRQQQVNDGCFPQLEDVPRHALSLTLPVFSRALNLSCVVPTRRKAEAVKAALLGPVTTECPATLMRSHPRAKLFLDTDSASLLPPGFISTVHP